MIRTRSDHAIRPGTAVRYDTKLPFPHLTIEDSDGPVVGRLERLAAHHGGAQDQAQRSMAWIATLDPTACRLTPR